MLFSTAQATSRPVLALTDVAVDRCGVVHGTLEVRPRRRSRVAEVQLGDRSTPVTIGPGEEAVAFAVTPGPWTPSVEVSASLRFVDTEVQSLSRPPWIVGVTPPADPAEGELAPLEVDLLGGCDASGLELRVDLDGRPVHVGPLGAVDVPWREGSQTVSVTVLDGSHEVTREELEVEVGPPCVDLDGDGYAQCHDQDCDDTDARVHPGAEDVVGNGIDDDCDGRNGQDRDRDGFEDVAVGGDDCDDHQPLIHPAAIGLPDADGDGASPFREVDFDCDGRLDLNTGAWDCDDHDAAIPGVEAPIPTGVDEDCDGVIDEGTVAYDDDGDGLSEQQGDCNDHDAGVHPGAVETPDCRDEDCDGVVDNGTTRPAKDDLYEPNDSAAAEVAGAWWRSGFFGGAYRPSSTSVRTVTRDLSDIERFEVFAHDGDFDSFHVSVDVKTVGDDRSYRVTITSEEGRSATAVIRRGGEGVWLGGKVGHSDTGTYTIEVRPLSGELSWCPVELVVRTG
jgi:hypothetical protein